jgi:hypothetical protein
VLDTLSSSLQQSVIYKSMSVWLWTIPAQVGAVEKVWRRRLTCRSMLPLPEKSLTRNAHPRGVHNSHDISRCRRGYDPPSENCCILLIL